MKLIDLTGLKFGRLQVLERAPSPPRSHAKWRCLCDCGNQSVAIGTDLRSGNSLSCGCRTREATRARCVTHGLAHHGKRSKSYSAWANAKMRCFNPKNKFFHRYGGRGITMCAEWKSSFLAFYEYMGERPDGMTLDRINNDDHYRPGNCRWATQKQQANNRANSPAYRVTK